MTVNVESPATDHVANPDAQPAPKKRGGGPRTQAGRDRSRRNALKHSQLAQLVFDHDMEAAIATRYTELAAEFLPANPYEVLLVGEMATATAKLARCAELMVVDSQRCVDRAAGLLGRRPPGRTSTRWAPGCPGIPSGCRGRWGGPSRGPTGSLCTGAGWATWRGPPAPGTRTSAGWPST